MIMDDEYYREQYKKLKEETEERKKFLEYLKNELKKELSEEFKELEKIKEQLRYESNSDVKLLERLENRKTGRIVEYMTIFNDKWQAELKIKDELIRRYWKVWQKINSHPLARKLSRESKYSDDDTIEKIETDPTYHNFFYRYIKMKRTKFPDKK